MKIAIDIRILAEKRVGKASQLLNTLVGLHKNSANHTYILYTQKMPSILTLDSRFKIKAKNIPMPFWHVWCWFDFTFMEKVDIFYASLSYIIPAFSKKCVVLVHDMVSFLGITRHNKKAQFIERLTLKKALKNARGIIAVSKSTAEDIVRICNVKMEDINVVYEGIDECFYRTVSEGKKSSIAKKYALTPGYIFFLSTLEPRKNIEGILAAYEKGRGTYPNMPELVMAGGKGWNYEKFELAYQKSSCKKSVKLLGHVPSKDLSALYQNASVYFFPVKYEGFGLTVLEAMASKTPVITSRVGAIPEIASDSVEYDVEEMKRKAYERASIFSMHTMANEIVSIIEKNYEDTEKN